MQSQHLSIGAQLANRPAAIEAFVRACRRVGPQRPSHGEDALDLSDPFDAEYVSAFSEIFNNIVFHGYGGGSDDPIEIAITVVGDLVTTTITEHGAPFDPAQIATPDLTLLPEGGLGIYIVEAFVDKFHYEPGPPNTWTLKKRYRGKDQTQ